MENKYYTPSIEEFHVGFEFEINSASEEDEWLKCSLYTLTDSVFNVTYGADGVMKTIAVPDCIRVKYLDREDIESLGFTYTEGVACSVFSKKTKLYEHNTLIKIYAADTKVVIKSHPDDLFTFDGKKVDVNIFSGTIKNKSELIKLLNQLGIK